MAGATASSQQRPGSRSAIACIVNGSAGSSKCSAAVRRAAELFEARGCTVTMLVAEEGGDISRLAKEAVQKGASVIVAAGGDGTVNAVATAVLDHDIPLGVLPLGTLNHFAKDTGIPTDLEPAVANIVEGGIAQVDVGEVNGKLFLNNSSLGLYPSIVREREAIQKKGLGKWLAFAVATLSALGRFPRLRIELQAEDGPPVEGVTSFVFVGNNQYAVSGLCIGEREHLDRGTLWVCRAPKVGRAGLARLSLGALLGRPSAGALETFKATQVSIMPAKRHILVATDGEVTRMQGPLNYTIRPKALRVVVPRPAHTS